MTRHAPIHARLTLISVMLFLLIAGFGGFTLSIFHDINARTDELRQRWLPSTRLLGDLNNVTSDYRAAEGDALLAPGNADRAATLAAATRLRADISDTNAAYQSIVHTAAEARLYARFSELWRIYAGLSGRVLALAAAGQQAPALTLYRSGSRSSYNAASDALGALTDLTVELAKAASARTARAYRQARVLIVAALLLAAGMLTASLIYIRRSISDPLVNMARTMRALANNKTDIDVAGLGRRDEIGEMARAMMVFRSNAIDLIQSKQGLAQQAAILEQKLAYEQQLTRLQRNFVIMVSHEFRTPLTIIDGHAQRLINARDPDLSPADRAGRIRSSVRRITNLMDNLITSARLIDGEAKLFFHPAEIDLADVLHEVCSFHRETAPAAQIEEHFTTGTLIVTGDRQLLFQTFSNLLSNAIKYSSEDIRIDIAGILDGATAKITVTDHGMGIPQQDLDRLFSRYYRGSNTAGIVGTGVGLYLAYTVVDLHGGRILVESTQGIGSTFTVVLPLHGSRDASKLADANPVTDEAAPR